MQAGTAVRWDAAFIPTRTDINIHVALDFDGTITVEDVGDKLFKTFGEFEPHHSALLAGSITVPEYYRRVVATLPTSLTVDHLTSWALQQQVDTGFVDLVSFCEGKGAFVRIASDGFNNYIRPILQREGVTHLDVRCNGLVWTEQSWIPEFGGATESCSCFCASCKRNNVIVDVADDNVLVYVGDGYSDMCAVEHADVVFAKNALAAFCTEKRIPHHPYRSLSDVQRILAGRFAHNDFKQRRQAVLARQRAFVAE